MTVAAKQKVNVGPYFAAELEEYRKEAAKPKFKYVVYTVGAANAKIKAGSTNKLGSVAAKTGIFTAKNSGVVRICLSLYNASTKKYADGKTELFLAIEKIKTKKQVMTYADQKLTAGQYVTYEYSDVLNTLPNVAAPVYVSAKPDCVEADPVTGELTAKKNGTSKVKITYTTDVGQKKPAVVTENVSVTVKIPRFAKNEISVKQGKTKKNALKNLIKGETVKWSSEDESIAGVDDKGKTTAKAPGSTKISATVSNPDGTDSVYSYTVNVLTPGK